MPLWSQSRPLCAQLDVEGHEAAVVPHLIQQGSLCDVDFMTIEWHDHLFSIDVSLRGPIRRARELLATLKTQTACGNRHSVPRVSTMDDESYRFPKYTDNLAWPNRSAICGLTRVKFR